MASEPGATGHEPARGDAQLRASDADRDAVLAQLQQHAAAGRLTPEELEHRAGRALGACTAAELAALVRDLPPAAAPGGRVRSWFVSVMGSSARRGRIRLGHRARAISVMASPPIDLCNADRSGPETVVRAFVFIGWPDIRRRTRPSSTSRVHARRGYDDVAAGPPRAGRARRSGPVLGLLAWHAVWRLPEELQSLPYGGPAGRRELAPAGSGPAPAASPIGPSAG